MAAIEATKQGNIIFIAPIQLDCCANLSVRTWTFHWAKDSFNNSRLLHEQNVLVEIQPESEYHHCILLIRLVGPARAV